MPGLIEDACEFTQPHVYHVIVKYILSLRKLNAVTQAWDLIDVDWAQVNSLSQVVISPIPDPNHTWIMRARDPVGVLATSLNTRIRQTQRDVRDWTTAVRDRRPSTHLIVPLEENLQLSTMGYSVP